jgi:hypothetical protein
MNYCTCLLGGGGAVGMGRSMWAQSIQIARLSHLVRIGTRQRVLPPFDSQGGTLAVACGRGGGGSQFVRTNGQTLQVLFEYYKPSTTRGNAGGGGGGGGTNFTNKSYICTYNSRDISETLILWFFDASTI